MQTEGLLNAQDWDFPVAIKYGPGRLREIVMHCRAAGTHRPLIVTDRGSEALSFVADLRSYLEEDGITSGLFADVSPNPRDDEIVAGKAAYRAGDHDGVIALGGGSGMDAGKAVCLIANNEREIDEFDYVQAPPDMTGEAAFPPLITIPTTAGTGAETESTAMITDTARLVKYCSWHPAAKPAVALLDPELTVGLPRDLTAWTGCDALVHAIEAYCVPAFHPLCDGAALESLRLIGQWLDVAYTEPENVQARGAMLVGSCLAGIAFIKGLGLVHSISHMVGAEYDTHHGLTNAIVLPAVLRYNAPAINTKLAPMATALGLADTSFDAFYDDICARLDRLDIPRSLADIDVPLDCARAIATKAVDDLATPTNPRPASLDDLEAIMSECLVRGRSAEDSQQ